MSAAVLKFPAARLAAKREARNERYQREFLNIWDQLPSEEHRDVVMAWAKLCAARDASEFAKARKAAIAAVQWLPRQTERAHFLRSIARLRPPRDDVVVPFAT